MNYTGILTGFLLVCINLMCLFMTNLIYKYQYSFYYLFFIMFIFSTQIPLFYYALYNDSIIIINFIWTIFYVIGIFVAGFIIHNTHFTPLIITAMFFGSISIILFLFTNKTQYDVILA